MKLRFSRRAGVAAYAVDRALSKIGDRFARWRTESYLESFAGSCGSVSVYGRGRFMCVAGLRLGENVHINRGAFWLCEGGVHVGDNTHFASNVTIYSRNHDYHGRRLPYDSNNILRPVLIGRNVWIGTNVTILPGSQIADGAIIGAGAVVHGRVGYGEIVGAAPLSRLKHRDLEHYERLDRARAYGVAGEAKAPRAPLLSSLTDSLRRRAKS